MRNLFFNYIFPCFIFLVILTASASAMLGVSPAIKEVDFSPGLQLHYRFNFFGDDASRLKITAEGDLADFARLSANEVYGTNGAVEVDVHLPSEIQTPGTHNLYIAAEEIPDDPSGFQVVSKIRAVIRIRVPYPGEYAEIAFSTSDAKEGDGVDYTLDINNRGKNDIITSSHIELYDSTNTKVGTDYLGSIGLETTKSTKYTGKLNTSSLRAGRYKALAIVDYGANSANAESTFRLGKLFVDIVDSNNDFQRNKINTLQFTLESFWNDPIENIYVEGEVVGTNVTFTTPSINLEGFQKNTVGGYFDTTSIPGDTFKVKARVHYGGEVTEKVFDLRFKYEVNWTLIAIVAAIILFLIIIIILYIWIMRLQKVLKSQSSHGKAKK